MPSQFARAATAVTGATLLAALGLPALAPSAQAAAQAPSVAATGVVRGRVVDAATQRPVANAQVQVVGTTSGALTNENGDFVIGAVPAGQRTLRVRRIGFQLSDQPVQVAAGEDTRVTFAIRQSATNLEQVVVTGTPGATERRAVGNAITQLDAATITTRASTVNLTEVLQGKSPGVTVLQGSGTAGTANDIRIRGGGSLTGNVRPIIFIDGVRFSTGDLGSFTPSGAGLTSFSGQTTNALDAINPQDIESIEIIKGPAAATLYGAEAAAGVIQIITKKGFRGQQRLQWNGRAEVGQDQWALFDAITNYTYCDAARVAQRDAAGNLVYPGCSAPGAGVGTLLRDNPLQRSPEAIRDGDINRYSLSVRGGADRYSFNLSGAVDRQQGVYLNNYSNGDNLRANFTLAPVDQLDVAVNVGYRRGEIRLPLGDESANGLLLSALRGRPGAITAASTIPNGFRTIGPEQANTYNNLTRNDRLTMSSTVNFRPRSWFSNTLTAGLDYVSSIADLISPPAAPTSDLPEGFAAQRRPVNRVFTLNYAGTVTRPLSRTWESKTSAGAQVVGDRTETLYGEGIGIGAPGITLITGAARRNATNTFVENNSVGYFAQQEFSYANRIFLNVAARADDHSSFGTDFDFIVYPKAQLSWVLSDEPALKSFFDGIRADNVRFRSAYGQAGRAPSAFTATQQYDVSTVTLGNVSQSALRTAVFGNPGVRAERGTEYEVGFDLGFFGGRLGAEATYYDKRIDDALFTIGLPQSLGFPATRTTNLGTTSNRGVELALNATPLQRRRFNWDAQLTLTTNRNRLVSFGDPTLDATGVALGGQSYGAFQYLRKGQPLGAYFARLPLRNPDGTPQRAVNANGTPGAVVLGPEQYIGTAFPKAEIGLGNTFTLFRDFRLYTLFDYRGGHHVFNQKLYNQCQAANASCFAVNDPRVFSPRTAADSLAAAEVIVHQTVPGTFIERADFVKLREVSLTYNIPQRFLRFGRIASANLQLTGRNLAIFSDYRGLDPEANGYSNRASPFIRVDAFATPMVRRFSLATNVTF